MANKIISGDPSQPFSLAPDRVRNGIPQPIAPSQAAVEIMLAEAGLIGGARMVNKDLVRQRLSAPIEETA